MPLKTLNRIRIFFKGFAHRARHNKNRLGRGSNVHASQGGRSHQIYREISSFVVSVGDVDPGILGAITENPCVFDPPKGSCTGVGEGYLVGFLTAINRTLIGKAHDEIVGLKANYCRF